MLHLDPDAPRTPRLPDRRFGIGAQLAGSIALHAAAVIAAVTIGTSTPGVEDRRADRSTSDPTLDVRHMVFVLPERPQPGSGGGGGGNQRSEPIRRAQGVGTDAITLRARRRPPATAPLTAVAAPAVEDVPLPSIVLDAKPMASGLFDQVGLPNGDVVAGASTGPGAGGGVGSGSGTGIGSGRGPGVGPGSGGGIGGGVYRPGGAVSAPRLVTEVRPKYTSEALRNSLQGTVVLEAVVGRDGCTSQIRILRSLDPGGLDEEAITAVAQWRFEPGRLARMPVDVLVTIMLDFAIR